MDYIRKIMNSEEVEILLDLPEQLKNKKLEVLILPAEEEEVDSEKEREFNPDDYRGILDKDEEDLKNDLDKMRKEWERL